MKSKKIEYWSCTVERHRHQLESRANACIIDEAIKNPNEEVKDRALSYIMIAIAMVNGGTYTGVAKLYGWAHPGRVKVVLLELLGLSISEKFKPETPPCPYQDLEEVQKHKIYWLQRVVAVDEYWEKLGYSMQPFWS
jgi:hypothetical protein